MVVSWVIITGITLPRLSSGPARAGRSPTISYGVKTKSQPGRGWPELRNAGRKPVLHVIACARSLHERVEIVPGAGGVWILTARRSSRLAYGLWLPARLLPAATLR